MFRVISAGLSAWLLIGVLSAAPAAAQAPAAPAPQALTYEMAVQVIDAAEAEARKNKWNVTIVVTDAAGVPVVLRRLTGASPRSYDIATRKAATVVATKLATSAYGEQLKAGTSRKCRTASTSRAVSRSCAARSSSARSARAGCAPSRMSRSRRPAPARSSNDTGARGERGFLSPLSCCS